MRFTFALLLGLACTLAAMRLSTRAGEHAGVKESPAATASTTTVDERIRFVNVDVFMETRTSPLAAYQFEFAADQGHIEIVGVESGGHPAFAARPPYYDPAALHREHRIVIADFSTAGDVPAGKTRVARLHLAVYGDAQPHYKAIIEAAASPAGKSIIEETTIFVNEGAP